MWQDSCSVFRKSIKHKAVMGGNIIPQGTTHRWLWYRKEYNRIRIGKAFVTETFKGTQKVPLVLLSFFSEQTFLWTLHMLIKLSSICKWRFLFAIKNEVSFFSLWSDAVYKMCVKWVAAGMCEVVILVIQLPLSGMHIVPILNNHQNSF